MGAFTTGEEGDVEGSAPGRSLALDGLARVLVTQGSRRLCTTFDFLYDAGPV